MGTTEGAIDVMAGHMKALAVTSPTRWADMPAVPTMIEAGYRDFQIVGRNGLFAPAGTPAPIVNRLNTELNKLLTTAEVRKQFDTLGFEVVHFTPAQFAAFLAEDIARFEAISKAAGLQKK